MVTDLADPQGRTQIAAFYRSTLLDDVIPFWLRHGLDREHGGILTALDRDGTLIDSDKSVWFQGRAAWMFATLYNTVEHCADWLEAARTCIEFSRRHCFAPDGKMYFTVTRDGRPLRMRRYAYSESFAAIASAAFAKATGEARAADDAVRCLAAFLHHNFTPGAMPPKFEPTRPAKSLGPRMIAIATAQELRANLGDLRVSERTCTEWIDACIAEIEHDFLKPQHAALMETVAPDGSIIDHFDGRMLTPGHALECAWFILLEAALRHDRRLVTLGTTILDWMWTRGWDPEHGGLLYYTDLHGLPVQEYWHDMKFWWPHNEAVIATLLAWKLTGQSHFAQLHRLVHEWSFKHFPDPQHGEWFGYLHRDGRVSSRAKGNLWKGPFHLPRMLWVCSRILESPGEPAV